MENIVEWDLRSKSDKVSLVLQYYVWGNMIAATTSLIILYLIGAFLPALWGSNFNDTFGKNALETLAWKVWLVAFLLAALYRHVLFARLVRESKARTSDAAYLEQMRDLKKYQYKGNISL